MESVNIGDYLQIKLPDNEIFVGLIANIYRPDEYNNHQGEIILSGRRLNGSENNYSSLDLKFTQIPDSSWKILKSHREINGEIWEIKKIDILNIENFSVINTHRSLNDLRGVTSPETIKQCKNYLEALIFLIQL
jgi:hypothetical protein